MADIAHELTDKELEEMEKRLSAIYERAAKELQEKADAYFKRFEELDAKKRALVDAGKLTEQEYKVWRQNKIMTGRHWTAMKEQAAQELLQANRTAQEYINGRLPDVYSLNYNSTGEAIEGAVSGYSFELVDASTVKNLATSDKTLLPYKYVDGKKDVRWNTAKVNSEVLQGILQGESIPKIAKRLQNVTEMNRASAIRNARTTVTSAENKGRMDSLHRAAEKGVITRKVWMAAIDARTREAHRLLDGQEQEIDDPFDSELGPIMYPGDVDADPANTYNCRCSLTYKVVGFGKQKEENEYEWESVPSDLTQSTRYINNLLQSETVAPSRFNGKVLVDNEMRFNGTANWDGSISLRSNASTKTKIHELLHQCSIGGDSRIDIAVYKNIEEGSVELFAQEICKKHGIKIGDFDYSYSKYVNALRRINEITTSYETEYDFAKALFETPLSQRADFLKELKGEVSKEKRRFFSADLKTIGAT